ncbi:MAG: 30S ribosome-binding factor RbfA [bacterium]|nr:30S ribosome-binding factor RbfA [bacterium]
MSHRVERFSSTLKQNMADILLNDINNPHLKSVTITNVVISPDLKNARVFVTSSPGVTEGESTDCLGLLERAKGFIRKTLARKMYLKYVPNLFFIMDDTMDETE